MLIGIESCLLLGPFITGKLIYLLFFRTLAVLGINEQLSLRSNNPGNRRLRKGTGLDFLRKSLDLGSSAAQSVVLMSIVITLTVVQFLYVEKNVQY